jgi:predicted glycosyltransferase
MKKILFYCQNLLGMGHLVRTTEIIRALVQEFEVCLIDGGQPITGFDLPSAVKIIHLPALQVAVSATLEVGKDLTVVGNSLSLEEVKESRKQTILETFDWFQPDCVITEGYPFSKNKSLSFEMLPLLERIQQANHSIKVVCSLRDIIMVKEFEDREGEEYRRCHFMNRYYDLLLIHCDPQVHRLEDNISTAQELTCPIYYTGYVVQTAPKHLAISNKDACLLADSSPMILVSVGGGKLGHDLLECVIATAPLLREKLPHQVHVFTGPLMEPEKYQYFQALASDQPNITLRDYTPHLLSLMQKADLSISLGGYNTTMNVLKTGVRSLIYPSNKDREQAIRAEKLEQLGFLQLIHRHELQPEILVQKIIDYLDQSMKHTVLDRLELQGARKTAEVLKQTIEPLNIEQLEASLNYLNNRLVGK